MRQVLILVPSGSGAAALRIARAHGATNVARLDGEGPHGESSLVIAHVSNAEVQPLLGDLETIDGLHIVLDRRDVMALHPPTREAAEQVIDVRARSPIEVFLGGLQSIGSWTGFLAYAAISGVVVWIGLYTETVYLLTAAMLIAPFAGPAMTLAMGTARGDAELLWRSAARYGASLGVAIAVALLLSLVLGPEVPTALMIDRSQVSAVAVLLPLAAGVAAGVNLSQPDTSSLVSGAATGVLVAASLAPPAGVVGMSVAMWRLDLAVSGVFLLMLQLVGINLAGAAVFRLFGLRARGVRYDRGRRWAARLSGAATVAALAGLLAWQHRSEPSLQRSTFAQRMLAEVHEELGEMESAELVEASVRFTRARIPGQESLLCEVFVQHARAAAAAGLDDEGLRREVAQRVLETLERSAGEVTPLVAVTVVQRGASGGGTGE